MPIKADVMEGTNIASYTMSALLGIAVTYLVMAWRSKQQLERERREKETEESFDRLVRLFGMAKNNASNDGGIRNGMCGSADHHSKSAVKLQRSVSNQPAHTGVTSNDTTATAVDRNGSLSWSKIPPMNHARSRFAAVTVNGRLYVFGGQGDEDHPIHCSVEMYDPIYRRWSIMGPMQFYRRHFAAALVGSNKVLICGGMGVRPNGTCQEPLCSAELYDVETGLSVLLPSMSVARFGCVAVAVKDCVYVFGGLGPTNALQAKGEMYRMGSNTWYSLPTLNISSYRFMAWELAAVATEKGNIVVMGDCLAATFDTERRTWEDLPANARIGTNSNGAVMVGGKIFVLCRDTLGKNHMVIEVFDLATRAVAPLRPPPIRAGHIIGASIAAIDEKLFVLGGFDPNPVNIMDDGCLSSGEELVIPSEWMNDNDASSKEENNGDDRRDGICLHCANPNALQYCGACGGGRYCYCSQECQVADWDNHKRVCVGKKKKTKKKKKKKPRN